ncbi:hypothetical protein AA14_25720 [Salmonella enterica]|uniref:Uncharacterized protein n=1 Tax=Salmonella enterica subsp. enterica serovar Panama TaxID=29472 RepID=A0A5U8JDF6_SALET|nr:hypothetical protein LFZ16_27855 [Salmonella enterica subsp. enterica serovar India str. SA20085604]EAA8760221.1 hypothetical protein [Salmonella enterica subsp. enterica serovar Rubislaw]EAO9158143.1 hypothetical protein [Salmonella enterica]EBR7997050.1 hypothetical protein [Salmonella enterica subsp. enterica serovar Panama]EBR8436147.1 hypothetical protein [Salmonella enterica subsp. enterica serovar Panama]
MLKFQENNPEQPWFLLMLQNKSFTSKQKIICLYSFLLSPEYHRQGELLSVQKSIQYPVSYDE